MNRGGTAIFFQSKINGLIEGVRFILVQKLAVSRILRKDTIMILVSLSLIGEFNGLTTIFIISILLENVKMF